MKSITMLLSGAAALFVLASCTTVVAEVPTGFARYDDTQVVRGVSPEDAVFRVRDEANDPEKDLSFWAEALENHLSEGGYLPRDQGEFVSQAGDGRFFEWVAPAGDEDWVYITAIVVSGNRLLIAEAAAPVEEYDRRRESIRESLATIDKR